MIEIINSYKSLHCSDSTLFLAKLSEKYLFVTALKYSSTGSTQTLKNFPIKRMMRDVQFCGIRLFDKVSRIVSAFIG